MGPIVPFANALRQVLGPCTNTVTTSTGTNAVVAMAGKGEVYGVSISTSASGAGQWALVDASSSGGTATVIWQIGLIPTLYSEQFLRPIPFKQGLLINYTATSSVAATLNTNVYWAPGPGGK